MHLKDKQTNEQNNWYNVITASIVKSALSANVEEKFFFCTSSY